MADDAAAPIDEDPFAQIGVDKPSAPPPPPTSAPSSAAPAANDNETDDPFAEFGQIDPSPSSATGAFARSAEKGALPAAASIAGAGAGAGLVASAIGLGAAGGSVEPGLGTAVGAFAGAVGGSVLAGYLGSTAQNWLLHRLPDSVLDKLGLDDRQERLDEAQHPMAAFIGGVAPYVMTMKPSAKALTDLPENATALQKLLAHPLTSRMVGGASMGGFELGQEAVHGDVDWRKVAVSTGFGVVFNRPNKIGEALEGLGGAPFQKRLYVGREAPPTVSEAGDKKVMGPGITEDVFHGAHEQAPDAALTSQDAARTESAALDEPPEPDLHAIAVQMHPELFSRYDELQRNQKIFAGIPSAEGHLATTNAEIEKLQPEIAAAYRRAADTTGTGTVEPEQFPSFAAMLAAREKETPAAAPAGFTTAKGSTYEIHEDGTTTRNKAARADVGHEGDFGAKPRTERTVYLDKPELAGALSAAGLQGLGPHGARVAIRDGKASLLTWNEKAGKWGVSPGSHQIPFTSEPKVGSAPLELWGKVGDVPGHEAYNKMHAGNAITEIKGAPNAKAEAPEAQPAGERGVPAGGEAPANVEGPGGAAAPSVPVPQRTIGAQRQSIADDVARNLIAAGRPEDEARAAAQIIAARYVTRAGRFGGKLGTPEELYAREGAAYAGPEGRAQAPAQVLQEGARQHEASQAAQTAAVETAAKPHESGLISQDFDTSDRVKNEWRKAAPFKDTEPFIQASWHNQRDLGQVGDKIASDLGLEFKNPGIKARTAEDIATIKDENKRKMAEASRRRLENKGKKHGIGGVTDQVRAGFNVEKPEQATQAIAELAKKYPVVDEGWQTTAGGYFDRKAYVRFPDGMIGEVQFWPPGMFAVKDHAHGLYEGVRELPPWHPMVPTMNKTAAEVYEPVRAALSDEWKAALGSGGNEPNLLPKAAGESTTASAASAALTSDHLPPESTQASEGVQKQASPSSEQGFGTDIFGVPNENVGPHAEPVNTAIDAADKINSLSPVEQKRELPKYSATAEQAPRGVDQPAGVFMFDPTALNVDAKRFQFKSGGDAYGVTGALRNVTKWDPAKAQAIIVWEQNDGKLFVADGHQRAGLARRLTEKGGAKGIELPGILYREKDGISADDIRAMAAVTNIANGSGSAIDGAKVLRARPDLMDGSLPLSIGKGKQAAALARLGDEPFKMVVNQVIPEHYGAVVGDLIPNDPARQEAAVKAIARFEPKNADEAAVLTQRVAQAELAKREEGAQGSMFGDLETAESTAGEEMKIVGRAIADLKKDKGLFSRVLANAERIEKEGSQINREAAQGVASDAEVFAKTLSSDAYTAGPIRDELIAAARELNDGKASIGDASTRIISALREQVEAHGLNRAGDIRGVEPAKEYAQKDELDFEAGAEGKPQALIPGVKPVSQRDLIQAAANKPLAPKVGQKPVGGLFGDSMDQKELFQTARGKIRIAEGQRPIISLLKDANPSTVIHESGHQFLEEMMRDDQHPSAPPDLREDAQAIRDWLGVKDASEIKTKHHEKFARGFEQYVREGVAPSKELAGVFAKFRDWLLSIYQSIKGLGTEISPEVRGVFDRMLEMEPQRTVIAERPPGGPQLHEIHAAEAEHIEPHEALPAADRIEQERERSIQEPPPRIANEIAAEVAKDEAANAGAKDGEGAGGHGEVVEGGGQPEPQSGGGGLGAGAGGVGAGGVKAEAEGVRPDLRSKLSGDSGPPLAPGPADLFGARESPLTDRAGNIRIDNLNTTEDVAQAIRDSAPLIEFTGDRHGRITDGQVLDLAAALGMDAAQISQRKVGQAFNAEQIVAARMLLIQSATQFVSAAKKAALSSATADDLAAYAIAKDRHLMIQGHVSGITTEAGRALRAFRKLPGQEALGEAADILQQATGKTLFQLKAEAIMGSAMDTPFKAGKFAQDSMNHSFGRMLMEYFVNNLISGLATHITYTVGNGILMAERQLLITPVAAAIGKLRAAGGREGERVHIGEMLAGLRGSVRGVAPALEAVAESFRTGLTTKLPGEAEQALLPLQPGTELGTASVANMETTFHDLVGNTYAGIRSMRDGIVATGGIIASGGHAGSPLVGAAYSPLGHIPDIQIRGVTALPLGTLARAPSRMVAAIHTFFRVLNYSAEINQSSFRQATEEGLTGNALDARVAQLRQAPTPEMMEAGAHTASDMTLMGQSGPFMRKISQLFNWETNLPILGTTQPLKFIDPFVHIAGQVVKQSVGTQTPLGFLSSEVRADIAGKNGNVAQDLAMAKMLVGSVIGATFAGLAAEGYMSGSGPSDHNAAAMWRLAGNQAHSVRIGNMWYSVHKLGPLGALASVAADLYEVSHLAAEGDLQHAAASFMHAFTQNFLEEGFLRGPADLLKAIEDSGRYGGSYVSNFLSSFVPYSVGLAQMNRGMDPYMRQTRTIMDSIKAKIPGLSETLMPRRDIWGEPMMNMDAVGGKGVTAIYAKKMSDDPVNKAMLDVGVNPGPVTKKVNNVLLTPEQYDYYAMTAGRLSKMALDKIVVSNNFRNLPPAQKHDVMQHIIESSRTTARGMVQAKWRQIPRDGVQQQRDRLTKQ